MQFDMKRLFALFLTSVLAVTSLSAENITLDGVFSSLTANRVTRGDFKQEKTAPKLKKPLKSSGSFVFSPDGILWQTKKPIASTMAISEKAIIQIKPDGSKNVIDGSSNDMFKTVGQTITSVFSGDRTGLENYFEFNNFTSTKNSWGVTLTPKSQAIASAVKNIHLGGGVSAGKASLDLLEITQSESQKTTYKLSKQKYSQGMTDAEKQYFN